MKTIRRWLGVQPELSAEQKLRLARVAQYCYRAAGHKVIRAAAVIRRALWLLLLEHGRESRLFLKCGGEFRPSLYDPGQPDSHIQLLERQGEVLYAQFWGDECGTAFSSILDCVETAAQQLREFVPESREGRRDLFIQWYAYALTTLLGARKIDITPYDVQPLCPDFDITW